MLELTWPGKSESARRACVLSFNSAEPLAWIPQCAQQQSATDALPVVLGNALPPGSDSFLSSPGHRVIAGDNLDVLRWCKKTDQKFDVIYIDPPYNTGRPFTYNDKKSAKAEKSGGGSVQWLNDIYPRLLLARDVLQDTGVLFVSIDDNEACHLLTVMREIFGHTNHLGTIKWRRKRKPSFLDKHMSAVFEYVLVFARQAEKCPRLLGSQSAELTRPVLNASNKIVDRMIPAGFPAACRDGEYAARVYRNRSLTFELLSPLTVLQGRVQSPVGVRGPFRIQQDIWEQTGFITRHFGLRRRVLAEELKRRHADDDATQWPTNEDAHDELRSVLGERIFDFPKPVGLLKQLLSMVSPVDQSRPQRCLDFYAGSGSFLIAALEQSRDDGVNRLVDLVQSRETIRSSAGNQYSDIAELCAHRVVLDSMHRGFSPSLNFLQLQQQE